MSWENYTGDEIIELNRAFFYAGTKYCILDMEDRRFINFSVYEMFLQKLSLFK